MIFSDDLIFWKGSLHKYVKCLGGDFHVKRFLNSLFYAVIQQQQGGLAIVCNFRVVFSGIAY